MKTLKKLLMNDSFLLILIIFFGFLIRIYNLKDNFIFAYDQARDAQRVWEIIYEKNLKIVGPETDIPGVFNGPLLYYILVPLYLISNFNPNLAAFFFVLFNLFNIIIIYFFSSLILKNKKLGLIGAFLWSISFLQLNFSKYISNASLMSLSSGLFFLGLALYFVRNEIKGLYLSSIGLAASIHFNFYLIYLLIFFPLFNILFQKKTNFKVIKKPLLIFVLLISNFILAEIKWRFMASKSLISYFLIEKDKNPILSNIQVYLDRLADSINFSFFSFNSFLGILLLLVFVYMLRENFKKDVFKFISFWFLSTLPLFAFRSGVLYGHVVNTTIYIPLTLIFAGGLYYVLKISRLYFNLFIILFFLSNFFLSYKDNFNNTKLLATKPIILKNEYQIIDYTYKEAKNKPFSVCAITEPLFINTLWSFLYKIYGEKKYGYLPTWAGPKQYLNKTFLDYDKNHLTNRFLIIEEQAGIPEIAKNTTLYSEDKLSVINNQKKFGNLTVQKRVFKKQQNVTIKNEELENMLQLDPRYSCFHEY